MLSFPAIAAGRYYSAQFIDLYTYNFAYVGSRTTGNGGGDFLLAGPDWQGEQPAGIAGVIRCETQLAMVLYRTQLFGPDDIAAVKQIQAGYTVQPLSTYLGRPAPPAAPPIDFPRPLTAEAERTSLAFFGQLNFVLQFCPTHPSEVALMDRFGRIGVGAGRPFDPEALAPEMRRAIEDGIADAWAAYDEIEERMRSGGPTSGDLFGSRDSLGDNYLYRMVGAVDGIYGNSKEEAIYPGYLVNATGEPLDGARHRYALRFAPGDLPPVNAFWSLTLYELPPRLLSANPIDRYLINSAMLPDLRRDPDGGLTLLIQHESPGPEWESNWLPAPDGPFYMGLRLYWPGVEAQDGTWTIPPLVQVS